MLFDFFLYDTMIVRKVIVMELLVANNLKKSYKMGNKSEIIIKGITLSISKGEFISIVGPSGSGKTTLLYVLSGLESYQEGSVLLFGKELSTYADEDKALLRTKRIGFVFQFYNLLPNLTVFENIMLAAVLGKQYNHDHIISILDQVGMKEFATYYPSQLSGGMQQRVAIARCLVNDPDIIFADEPIGNLDFNNGKQIMELFETLNKVHNKTILMVTHNEDATKYGTRTIHMLDGMILKDETSNS